VRTSLDPAHLTAPIQSIVAQLDPDAEFSRGSSMRAAIAEQSETYRIAGTLFSILGLSAFLIVIAGIYGAADFNAEARMFETAVRFALGAGRLQILSALGRSQAVPVILGVLAGSGVAFAAGRFLSSLLFKTSAWDGLVVVLVWTAAFLCAGAATLIPARRALKVAPASVLKGGS
jgi:putative ABC transport system permease protein